MRPCWIWALLALANLASASDFVGSTTCAACHADTYQAWQGSHHDLAMQHADAGSVLGDFEDAEFSYGGITTTFFRRGERYFVRTDGADGELTEHPVAYTFGVFPLQQYLIPFPGGRLQALGIAWDSRPTADGGQRWFHLYPDEIVDHRHELHWSSPQQNWNFMCASCHSTNLHKGYDAEADRFETTWSDINVGCEACHGPGAAHLRWAALPEDQRSTSGSNGFGDFKLPRATAWTIDPATGSAIPQPPAAGHQVEICADCHARRSEIAPGHERSPRLFDHFMPALLTEGLYHADGQIDGEVFEWGSFLQSRMHAAGVVCSDCHEPHSLKLRAPGDAVCAQCHLPQRFATTAHHHHDEASAGARCIGCHMPAKTYMVVDPRHDHSLRIPRPDQSVAIGTPNACNNCHGDRSTEWAAGHFTKWYPDPEPVRATWTEAFAQARAGDPAAAAKLVALIADSQLPAIVRATAVSELAPFLRADSTDVLPLALNDDSPLLRLAGLQTLERLPPEQRHGLATHLLRDPLLAIRAEAGRVLAASPRQRLTAAEREHLDRAMAEYAATLAHNADRAFAHVHRAEFYATGRGTMQQAEDAYRQALERDPDFVPAYTNFADLLRRTGRDEQALALLERGLQRQPEAAALHHAAGLLQVGRGDMATAVAYLERAASLAPENPRFDYVYAIALNSTGHPEAALKALREASGRHPYDRDILMALVTVNLDANDSESARAHLTRLLEVWPDDAGARRLAQALPMP